MLVKFSVTNFKCFKDEIVFDLSKTNNYAFSEKAIKNECVNKAIVYGFNGEGKSNLGVAIMDITTHLSDFQKSPETYFPYLNLSSDRGFASFKYEFSFKDGTVVYEYDKKNMDSLMKEKLIINGKTVIEYDYENHTGDVSLLGGETLNLEDRQNKISRVKFVKSNSILVDCLENNLFKQFTQFVDRMLLFYSLQTTKYIGLQDGRDDISTDIIHDNVKDFQSFLKKMGLDLSLDVKEVDGEKKLLVVYKHGSRKSGVDFFRVASAGTKSLALFYYWYIKMKNVSFVFIDEFDAFFHFELARDIVKILLDVMDVQVIFTTHNTDLLSNDLLRPDCFFYMSNNNIKSLSECTEKDLRKAHNLQKMFKAGAFYYE